MCRMTYYGGIRAFTSIPKPGVWMVCRKPSPRDNIDYYIHLVDRSWANLNAFRCKYIITVRAKK